MPDDINPKEMALMLYKLSIENNAMLKQTLIIQTEIMKMLKIIHFSTNIELTGKTAKSIELLYEGERARQVEFIENMLPILEKATLLQKRDWTVQFSL